ncbi:MAG: PepSY domain-containing protein [Rhodanobacteraceae bacterium]
MQKHMLAAAVAASLLCAGGMAMAQNAPAESSRTVTTTTTVDTTSGALSESQIKSDIADAGYKEVKGLEFKHGVWQAKARGGNHKWMKIRVGPTTGKVYEADAPSKLNKNEIKAKLTSAGYQNIGDVDFDNGLWSAEARSPTGEKVNLLVDPDNGSVVASEKD